MDAIRYYYNYIDPAPVIEILISFSLVISVLFIVLLLFHRNSITKKQRIIILFGASVIIGLVLSISSLMVRVVTETIPAGIGCTTIAIANATCPEEDEVKIIYGYPVPSYEVNHEYLTNEFENEHIKSSEKFSASRFVLNSLVLSNISFIVLLALAILPRQVLSRCRSKISR